MGTYGGRASVAKALGLSEFACQLVARRTSLHPLERPIDVNLADEFQSAVTSLFQPRGAGPELLPLLLVQACVNVVPVSGAGLSMTDHLRIPLAASDATVAIGERLQVTLGEGPCLTAATMDDPLVADAATMTARWPTFSQAFLAETPYRSVASLPLRSVGGIRMGAMDLYSEDPQPLDHDTIEDIDTAIAVPIASMMFRQPITQGTLDFTSPTWLNTDWVSDRMNVWVAIGMVMSHLKLTNSDALAVLRGYAFSHERTLDEIARVLTDRDLQPLQLLV